MGQCGVGHSQGPVTSPKLVTALHGTHVQQISAGTSHSLAWTAVPSDRYFVIYLRETGHFVWLVQSPGTVSHWTLVPFQHYQLSEACSRHIFSHVPTLLTVSIVRAANIVRRLCSDSSHVTVPYKLSFYYYYYYYYYC